jgi:TPR repeat protein
MSVGQSLWGDRLAEVWASPGRAGAGVIVGAAGVLTARHVVAEALGADGGRILSRVVRPGLATAPWVSMRRVWDDAEWDVALLAVDQESEGSDAWLVPTSGHVVVAALGSSVEPGCEAVGFPESAVQHGVRPSDRVRQSEQIVGRALSAGQAKRPVNPERALPRRWVPLDVDTATPGTQAGWGGMSGAGVLLPDGRLVGLLVAAEAEHQERRLYLVPLADLIEEETDFAGRLSVITGRTEVAQARDAPQYRAVLQARCLGADGLPRAARELEELSAFGVKPADLPGEPRYLKYVPRDQDSDLRAALCEAIETRRMLLVVGASASGKSRSASCTTIELLPRHMLVVPRPGMLGEAAELPFSRLGPAVVWLDDAEVHTHIALRDSLGSLLQAGVVVVGTIRHAELERLAPTGDVRNPAGEAFTDPSLVLRMDWRLRWSDEERARLSDRVAFTALLDAVARGTPVGVYCVAGPELLRRLDDGRADEERPARFALVRTVLDWFRTGIGRPISIAAAAELMPEVASIDGEFDADEIDDALTWATTPVLGVGRRTGQALLSVVDTDSLTAHDYVRDEDDHRDPAGPSEAVWASVLLQHADITSFFQIGVAAQAAGRTEIAVTAWTPLAEAGHTDAMNNLGVTLQDSDPESARRWYERAAEAGETVAMRNLGLLLQESDPEAARHWFECSAERGHAGAMNNLGRLLETRDPATARFWWERAGEAGHAGAMNNLGLLLRESDPEAARGWFERAAEAGEAVAMYNLGQLLWRRDPTAARQWYEQAAEAGHADAINPLGALLAETDAEAAQSWWERAAELGDTRAMKNLGLLLDASDPEAAQRWWERAAEAGELDAMLKLGMRLVESDPAGAQLWWERAAESGVAVAMFNLGLLLQDSDPEAARRWYEQAAEAGITGARLNLGVLLEDSDPEAARRWYEQAAEAGDTKAMRNLGLLLEGRGAEAAERWYERAAEAGDTTAMNDLGRLLAERAPEAAERWYERAAEAGDTTAMLNLGVLLAAGDPKAAQRWYERAAEAGDSRAMFNLALLLREKDSQASRHWSKRAAEAGEARAMNNLGVLLVESDPEAAQLWLQRAAEAGHSGAMNNLGLLLEETDPEAARLWWERSAEAGNVKAMNNLGLMLTESEPKEALRWWKRAAEAGNVDAMNNLAVVLEESDPEGAKRWHERAAHATQETTSPRERGLG